ncbi:MarR family transcriptional regulator [Catenovulum sp. 2E275]|uniref:MarR family winged helix-turn-helix transcriptional regulator n=1 Tax=Catenovulum sp. 2E275 TaxID=2980497 RepID=UPI0021CF211B|nr:MarR family transcriptional regulator [Catenovulum sp. 2E275]MCU4676834.1 MarR family transcriptional regulator [Catenovulum sp. 2E275]
MPKTDIEKTLGYALHSSAFLMKQAIKQLIHQQQIDTTPEAFFMLNLIPDNGIEQQELINKTHKDKAAITRLLDQLTRQNWIIRRVVKDNKRKCIIKISEPGLVIKRQLNQALAEISQKMIKGIPTDDLRSCFKVLNMLSENLDELVAEQHNQPLT